jgi:hypothetical protein
MKKIKTTDIIAGSAMPLKSGSLDHLQSAYQEPLIDIIQTFEASNDTEGFPNFTTPIIMYGCRWTGTQVTQGVVVYGTEIYRCQAVNITLGVGQVIIGTITTTYLTATNADPVIFSDSTSNNVHEIRQIVWSAGTSGTPGTFDFDDCLMWGRWTDIPYNSSYLSASSGTWTSSNADFNLRYKFMGRTVFIYFEVKGSLSATPGNVTIDIPFNSVFKDKTTVIALYTDAVTNLDYVICEAVAGTSNLKFFKSTGTFTTGAGFSVLGQITVELDKF